MAKLTKEQEQAVGEWAAEGAGLNEIQDRLKRLHDITLTYLDARLLVAGLGLKLREKPRENPPEEKPYTPPASPPIHEESAGGAFEAETVAPSGPQTGGGVTVRMDTIAIPGMLASGKATFSDGKTVSWYLDELGRLGMKAPEPGYKPPTADIPAFQRELDRALKQAGF